MLVRLAKIRDDLRSSLFFIPMLFVVGGVFLAMAMLVVDDRFDPLPTRFTATVDSSRGILSVIAQATLSFAGIAFSVSLLLISLASSQFSPRVVHGLFRDPFSKRVMGVVIGTFTYCVVVLRAVRSPLEDDGTPVVPSFATMIALVLGIVSILSIIGFISHSAHSMDVSKILHRVTTQSIDQIRETWDDPDADDPDDSDEGEPSGDGTALEFDQHGWVQQVDSGVLLRLLDEGATLRLDTAPGRYAIPTTPLATIWPAPDDESIATRVRRAVIVGQTRTTQQDPAYGLRQLVDVALKALSPGVNDPTTAQDALFHMAAVLHEALVRRPPHRVVEGEGGRRLLRPQMVTHDDLVELSFDEVRLAAVGQPTVQVYLLEILHLLSVSLDAESAAGRALRRQAELIVESNEQASVPERDRDRVAGAFEHRFGANAD